MQWWLGPRRWPVKNLRVARRNPFHPNQIETLLAIALSTGLLQKLGEKLSSEVFDWVRHKVKPPAPKKKAAKKKPRHTRK
jgi:hypothetical protein